jgi:N-acetylmuramoyl-L-alanine amidase
MNERAIKGVVVDAGHGGNDPGAVNGNIYEKDFTLEAAKYIYDRLNQLGIPAVLTRDSDSSLPKNERIQKVLDSYGADEEVIVVSNHINSGGGESHCVTSV